MTTTWHEYAAFAVELAQRAGILIRTALSLDKHVQEKSSQLDIVTEFDKASEALILGEIRARYPTHRFIAEESHTTPGQYDITDDVTWIVDPIDGTNNFVHALPHVCVSIAVMVNRELVCGVVHSPVLCETFHAVKGAGAFVTVHALKDAASRPSISSPSSSSSSSSASTSASSSTSTIPTPTAQEFSASHTSSQPRRFRVSTITDMKAAAVITEMGYDRSERGVDLQLEKLRYLTVTAGVQSVRVYGSCALNMCSVALGRAEAYYEGVSPFIGPKPWDVAAAAVILREAGGMVLDPNGTPFDMCSGRILAVNNADIARVLAQASNEAETIVARRYPL